MVQGSYFTRSFTTLARQALSGRKSDVEGLANKTMFEGKSYDRIFYIIALPKSASRNIYRTLLKMQDDDDPVPLVNLPVPRTKRHWGVAAAEVRPHFLEDLPRGMVHSHTGALPVSVGVLKLLGVRHIVTVRHPADHLAALYCHLRRLLAGTPGQLSGPPPAVTPDPGTLEKIRSMPPRWHSIIHPVHVECVGNKASVEDALDHLIRDGYLAAALDWIANWTRFAVPGLTKLVRYEDLLDNSTEVIGDVYRFLWEKEPSRFADPLSETSASSETIYPRGSSAGQGIWRAYFSPSNIDAFNRTVEAWQMLHGRALDPLYPELTLR